MNKQIEEAAHYLVHHPEGIALTGAGISVASGIPDFRSRGGLWERFDPMIYAAIETFYEDPFRIWEMLYEMYLTMGDKQPNAGHLALAQLERLGLLQAIITQNIDRLHHRAGNSHVIEFHGNAEELQCLSCGYLSSLDIPAFTASLRQKRFPPTCPSCKAVLKPAVVFFGEAIPEEALEESYRLAQETPWVLVVATSAQVAPASLLPELARVQGATIIEINKEASTLTRSGISHLFLEGPQEELLPLLLQEVQKLLPSAQPGLNTL